LLLKEKGFTSISSSTETSTQAAFRNQNNNFQPKTIISRDWCNLCDDNHKESTCEVKKRAQE
jgi:hypothetical protein